MNTNIIDINHREENNSYKCHFCRQNIDVYGIEKHFTTFHKFRNSVESEYVCEFCKVLGKVQTDLCFEKPKFHLKI